MVTFNIRTIILLPLVMPKSISLRFGSTAKTALRSITKGHWHCWTHKLYLSHYISHATVAPFFYLWHLFLLIYPTRQRSILFPAIPLAICVTDTRYIAKYIQNPTTDIHISLRYVWLIKSVNLISRLFTAAQLYVLLSFLPVIGLLQLTLSSPSRLSQTIIYFSSVSSRSYCLDWDNVSPPAIPTLSYPSLYLVWDVGRMISVRQKWDSESHLLSM